MLTNTSCKNAICPEGKTRHRLSDAGGLYLEVAPNGSKRWFAKYRFHGREKRLALGSYPEVTLKEARDSRDAARKVQQAGTDPVQQRKADRLVKLKFPRFSPEFSCSINHLRWISGLGF